MAAITSLPDKVIEIILEDENVSIKDAMNLKSTCKKFHEIKESKKFWEKKFYQRYPTIRKKYNKEKRKKIFEDLNFKRKITANIKYIKLIQSYEPEISNHILSDFRKKELGRLLISIAEDSMIYYFVLDEINIIVPPDIHLWKSNSNLPNMYYFDQINSYLRQYRFIYNIDKYLKMPKEKKLLERLIIIMVQHFLPYVSYSVVKTFLNDIAREVLLLIKNEYPMHSIFSTSLEKISFWRDNNIERNFWNREEAMQIIEILEEFMPILPLKLETFLLTLDIPYKLRWQLIFHSFLQTATYESVARRLGIYCCTTFATFPNVEKNVWKPKFNIGDLEEKEYYFKYDRKTPIAFYGGYEYMYDGPLYWLDDIEGIRIIMFFLYESMKYGNYLNLIYNKRSLLGKSLPIYVNEWFKLYKNIEQINIETVYNNITESLEGRTDILFFERNEQEKKRNREVTYSIGMLVTHTPNSKRITDIKTTYHPCNGVIIGWHFKCDREFLKLLRKVDESNLMEKLYSLHILDYLYLLYKLTTVEPCTTELESQYNKYHYDQTHYVILADGNEIRYVAQDTVSLYITTKHSELINNVEIGRYFTKFAGTHYVPNETLEILYPQDITMLKMLEPCGCEVGSESSDSSDYDSSSFFPKF